MSVAVEGWSDTGMVAALLAQVGLGLARPCLVKNGVGNLDQKIPGLAQATIHNPWIIFRDSDGACPVELRDRLLQGRIPGEGFVLRLACSMTESWLLADDEGFSSFFKVAQSKVPDAPDDLPHAKNELLRLCGSSRSRRMREDVVRDDGSPGPLYVSRLNEFAAEQWNVARARHRSPSLARAVTALGALRERLSGR